MVIVGMKYKRWFRHENYTDKQCNKASLDEKIARREEAKIDVTVSRDESTIFVVQKSFTVLTSIKNAIDGETGC